jgi:hypothetical protein
MVPTNSGAIHGSQLVGGNHAPTALVLNVSPARGWCGSVLAAPVPAGNPFVRTVPRGTTAYAPGSGLLAALNIPLVRAMSSKEQAATNAGALRGPRSFGNHEAGAREPGARVASRRAPRRATPALTMALKGNPAAATSPWFSGSSQPFFSWGWIGAIANIRLPVPVHRLVILNAPRWITTALPLVRLMNSKKLGLRREHRHGARLEPRRRAPAASQEHEALLAALRRFPRRANASADNGARRDSRHRELAEVLGLIPALLSWGGGRRLMILNAPRWITTALPLVRLMKSKKLGLRRERRHGAGNHDAGARREPGTCAKRRAAPVAQTPALTMALEGTPATASSPRFSGSSQPFFSWGVDRRHREHPAAGRLVDDQDGPREPTAKLSAALGPDSHSAPRLLLSAPSPRRSTGCRDTCSGAPFLGGSHQPASLAR